MGANEYFAINCTFISNTYRDYTTEADQKLCAMLEIAAHVATLCDSLNEVC